MEFATKCIHESGAADATGSVTPAIYLSSTFAHPKLGDTTGFNYTRESNPTRARLEQLLAALENGVDALAFSSGMAAVDAVMNLFAPGDHIITGNDLYRQRSLRRLLPSVPQPQRQKRRRVHLCAYF